MLMICRVRISRFVLRRYSTSGLAVTWRFGFGSSSEFFAWSGSSRPRRSSRSRSTGETEDQLRCLSAHRIVSGVTVAASTLVVPLYPSTSPVDMTLQVRDRCPGVVAAYDRVDTRRSRQALVTHVSPPGQRWNLFGENHPRCGKPLHWRLPAICTFNSFASEWQWPSPMISGKIDRWRVTLWSYQRSYWICLCVTVTRHFCSVILKSLDLRHVNDDSNTN